MKINLMGDIKDLQKGIERVEKHWGIEFCEEGIKINVHYNSENKELTYAYDGSEGIIKYSSKNNFFRALNRWCALYQEGQSFKESESQKFEKIGTMIDSSRNAVLNVEGTKEFLVQMAALGMNQAMLYTEDTYEVNGDDYFGYLRGAYTKSELKELDNFAFDLGIEMMPCIQTLGHLYQVLQHGTHSDIQDTSDVLLVGEKKTYEFIRLLLKEASEPFRSNRIHIGMDEAFGVGTGKYKALHGERDTFDIMNEHVQKVIDIAEELGLDSMMWSDMYFRAGSSTGDYYDKNAKVPEHIINEIPNVDMVFWDYYHEEESVYEEFLKSHIAMRKKVIFAGGIWTWNGISPNFGKTLLTTEAGLAAAKKLGIKEVFATLWGDDGGETPMLSTFPGLQMFADLSYSYELNYDMINKVSTFNIGISFDEFMLLTKLDETPGIDEHNLQTSAASKVLLWQDPLLGRFDKHIEKFEMNKHYEELAKQLSPLVSRVKYKDIFEFYLLLSEVLSNRAELGVQLKRAYDMGDKEKLACLLETVKELKPLHEELRKKHRKVWMKYNKAFGWEVLDIRYGGIVARLQSVSDRLSDYLNGDISQIEELEARKLKAHQQENMIGRGLYEDICSTSKLSGV